MVQNAPSVQLAHISIATPSGPVPISIRTGDAFMVAGPNGVGKSALLYSIYRSIGSGKAEYYPGHRQITFNNGWDTLGQDIDQLRTNLYTHVDVFNRYKNHWAEDMFKSVVRRLSNLDATHNARISQLLDLSADEAIKYKAENTGPIETLNAVFAAARMAVRFVPSGRGLRAKREGMEYDIEQLSDGERAALLIAGAVIVQDPYTIIAIDEPERNLHPSIAGPLVNALILSRPDVAFLFASHDMNLIAGVATDSILYVKNSQVVSTRPEARVFDVKVLSGIDGISDDLRRDLLGSRQDILFIEGITTSIDFAVYNALFPDWKVTPKGGADQVSEAVKTLSDNPSLHWFKVAGLIDRDGRSEDEISTLAASGINAVLCPTVENLLFLRPVIEAVAAVLYETEGGSDTEQRMTSVEASLPNAIANAKSEIVARASTWRVNRRLAEQKVSVASMRDGSASIQTVDPATIKSEVESELSAVLHSAPNIATLEKLPIKNTPIPAAVSGVVGCNYDRYKKIVFRQLETNETRGKAIRAAMMTKLPQIAAL